MIFLVIDENTLETGVDQAYRSFNRSASHFLEGQGLQSTGPASKIFLNFCIAVMCGIVGAIFTFPGLRMAKMHWDTLTYSRGSKFLQLLLHTSFALPFLLVMLWVKPISRDYLTVRVFSGMKEPLLTSEGFDAVRLILVVVAVVLRFVLMPIYLQSYLNLAYSRVEEQKKEAGRITNVELQKKIASIFYYLCVVTLQYVAPIIMCLYFALMYKSLGGYKWSDLLYSMSNDTQPLEQLNDSAILPDTKDEQTNIFYATQLSLQELKAIFTTEVYRGLFGFATWWSCFVWFATSSIGMVYQSYFTKL